MHHIHSQPINKSSTNELKNENDDAEKDGPNDDCDVMHFRENSKRCGYVVYTVSTYVAVHTVINIILYCVNSSVTKIFKI